MKKRDAVLIVCMLVFSLLLLSLILQQFTKNGLTGFSTGEFAASKLKLVIQKNFLNSMLLVANSIILLVIFLYYHKLHTDHVGEVSKKLKEEQHQKRIWSSKLEILLDELREMQQNGFSEDDMRRTLADYDLHPIAVNLLLHEETEGKLHELVAFVKQQKQKAKAENMIRKELLEKGWQREVVSLAFE